MIALQRNAIVPPPLARVFCESCGKQIGNATARTFDLCEACERHESEYWKRDQDADDPEVCE